MAAGKLPDLDDLALERVRLERSVAELTRQLERAEERTGQFPSSFGMREVRRLRIDHASLLARIEELDALLLPLRRTPEG
jgi:hypothetical protein